MADTAMRICSLLPGATEVVAALGLGDQLVGISHECDFPPSIQHVPVMIEPLVGKDGGSGADIDRQVKELVASGQRLYQLNEQAFRQAKPELILTQELCHVCAVTPDQLTHAIQSLAQQPDVLTFSPSTLHDMINDIERIAGATGTLEKGTVLANSLRRRLETIHTRATTPAPPRVLCLEWLTPLYVAGHWVPEMVELAGGHDVLGVAGVPSKEITWAAVEAAHPDIILVMPCGYTVERTIEELRQPGAIQEEWRLACARWPEIYVVDASSYFSRPGPRLVDGVELLASILQPGLRRSLHSTQAIKLNADMIATGTQP